jgi:NAD(P)-dependent dehydrogenase (short-subunit alcohol dehydrogenase family)
MSELSGRVALVTGASRGIGRACAVALAEAGADVGLTARNSEQLAEVAAAVQALGRRALVAPCDMADRAALDGVVGQVTAGLGPIDILVNNAGITEGIKFTDMSEESWDRVLTINLDAVMRLCQLTVGGMAKRRWGRIITIASLAARTGLRYSAAYTASKHGVLGLTRSLALDYARQGVTINAICPGWVATDMVKDAVENIVARTGRTPEQALAELLAPVPQGRLIEAEEVAAAMRFLVSEGARGITGQSINVDGGTLMC